MASSTGGVEAFQKRTFESDRLPLVEPDQKHHATLVEMVPALLEGAVLGAPKLFWEAAVTSDYFRYNP